MAVDFWHPLCEQNPGYLNTGWVQPVLMSPCCVISDLPPHLFGSHFHSFRGESAAAGQPVTKYARCNLVSSFKCALHYDKVQSGTQETPALGIQSSRGRRPPRMAHVLRLAF